MPTSEAQRRAVAKHTASLDTITIRAPKGTKQDWKGEAAIRKKSMNQFIIDAVLREIEKR